MITRTNYSVVKEIVSQELKGIEIKKEISGGWGFHGSSAGKESACNAGDLGLIPGSGRSPEEINSNLLQYSCLGNSKDRGALWATVHGVAKS